MKSDKRTIQLLLRIRLSCEFSAAELLEMLPLLSPESRHLERGEVFGLTAFFSESGKCPMMIAAVADTEILSFDLCSPQIFGRESVKKYSGTCAASSGKRYIGFTAKGLGTFITLNQAKETTFSVTIVKDGVAATTIITISGGSP